MGGVESIVQRGTFALDNSTFVNTIDKVKANGHYYSDKPAMSYLVAVPVYSLIYNLFGINFKDHRRLAYYLITLFTVGLGISIMLVYFFKLLKRYELATKSKIFYTASLFLCTLVFTYSVIYSNHGLATALLPIAFYALLNLKKPKHYLFTGLLCGFTICIDLVAGGIFTALFGAWLFIKAKKKKLLLFDCAAMLALLVIFLKFPVTGSIFAVIYFIWLIKNTKSNTALFYAGVLIPVLIALLINFAISGSIIPFNVNTQLFKFSGSAFNEASLSGVVSQSGTQLWKYAFDLVIGKRGFILFTPVLLFAIAGLIIALFRKEHREEAIIVGMGIISVLLFYITRTNNHGGCCYGLRWTVPLIPLIYYFTPLLFEKKSKYVIILKVAFVMVLLISTIFAFVGAMEPWSCTDGLLPKYMVEGLIHKLTFNIF